MSLVPRFYKILTPKLFHPVEALTNVYPFVHSSTKEISFQNFQKLFGPNGDFDKFFKANLASYVNTQGSPWSWNPDATDVVKNFPPNLPTIFEKANKIKLAFFPNDNPGFNFYAKNIYLGSNIDDATLEINGVPLLIQKQSVGLFNSPPQNNSNNTVYFQWPGPPDLSSASLILHPALEKHINSITKPGVWGVFRLFDVMGPTNSVGGAFTARANLNQRVVYYLVNSVSQPNPFTLGEIKNFSCPDIKDLSVKSTKN